MGTKLGIIIANARKRRRLTLQQIADAVGVSYPAVQQWEKGKTDPSRDNAQKLSDAIKIPIEEIEEALASEQRLRELLAPTTDTERKSKEWNDDFSNALRARDQLPPETAKRVEIFTDYSSEATTGKPTVHLIDQIPVLGIALAGEQELGEFHFNGEIHDYIIRPIGLRFAKNAYAVYVISDSMYPRFEPNELVYINPDRIAVANDYVIVELNDGLDGAPGSAYIKKLAKRGPSIITLEQFNPPRQFDIQTEAVKNVHRVVPTRELLAL